RQIDFARFLAAIEKVDQVIECHLVSGGYDYLLKFVTAGIDEYQTIMELLTDMDVGMWALMIGDFRTTKLKYLSMPTS
ncbi:Lrp/AsnC ligand binding domain-containing protein, partial [Rhizobium leguminosarum]|uniref:Lrp/AsnC ligand binding domain-containing protein n=1 Tax=Rhizobium leguminosarum TaxID=384 RepID=UPI003F96F2C1